MPEAASASARWSRWLALAVVLGPVAVVYAATLCPTVYWYDSAEFAAHAAGLGVPHPPGYPLYTLVAHAFTWLPIEPALAVNLMSLVFGLLSVGCVYVLARGLGAGRPASTIAAWCLAFAPSIWQNAVVSEVYTPGLAFTLGVFVVLQRRFDRTPSWRWAFVAGLGGGLGVGVHMSIATLGLGYAFLLGTGGSSWWARLRAGAAALGGTLLGLLVFVYIPLRRFDRWDDPAQWVGFFKNATGGSFKRKFLADYDLGDRVGLMGQVFLDNLGVVGIVLALAGLWVLARRNARWAIAIELGIVGNVWWFFNYAVPDLDVFVIPSIALCCIAIAIAIDELIERLHAPRGLAWVAAVLPVVAVGRHWARADLSEATEAKAYGERVCEQLPASAVVIHYSRPAEWRLYAVLLYMQQGLDRCSDVTFVNRPDRLEVRRMIATGTPVYALVETEFLARDHAFEPDGELLRVR